MQPVGSVGIATRNRLSRRPCGVLSRLFPVRRVVARESVPRRLRHPVFSLLGLRRPIVHLSQDEQELLLRSAAERHAAVELGVAEGGSAHLIATVLAPDATLDLVDPFFPGALKVVSGQELVAKRLLNNARVTVRFHKMLSWDAPGRWSFPSPDLLFIDADHAEDAVRRDWSAWAPLLTPDAVVLLHDAFEPATGVTTGGPGRMLDRLLAADWRLVGSAGALAAIARK